MDSLPPFRPLSPAPSAATGAIIAQVLASRLCHDLVSPVGALVNGVDLMRSEGALVQTPELALIGQSAERAAALLTFQRLAFGMVDASAPALPRADFSATLRRALESSRVGVLVPEAITGPPVPRPVARAAALACLCLSAAVGRRGRLSISLAGAQALPLTVAAEGEDRSLGPAFPARFAANGTMPEPRAIEFSLLPVATSVAKLGLEVGGAPGIAALRLS